ncbi:MAG: type I restriction-modification system subunit M N-terminal domain-containing protein [Methylococcaceae bacterium]|nr:type I restriction-modification system subunit M N-terminal domain-containing protein [Methylococcaceae bacterium]
MQNNEQQFLTDLEKTLWTSANKLLPSLDAAQYKHVILGLVFLKYVSDSFQIRRDQLRLNFQTPGNDYYFAPEDYEGGSEGEAYQAEINSELEERDY